MTIVTKLVKDIMEFKEITDELKPCPFCGRNACIVLRASHNDGADHYDIACQNDECILAYGFDNYMTIEELPLLAMNWNIRPNIKSKRKRLTKIVL